MNQSIYYWKVNGDDFPQEEAPNNLQMKEIGVHSVQDKVSISNLLEYQQLMKTKKQNIGTKDNPKMVIIGDYWDDEIVTQLVDILKEYEDLFPKSFSDMKGISS